MNPKETTEKAIEENNQAPSLDDRRGMVNTKKAMAYALLSAHYTLTKGITEEYLGIQREVLASQNFNPTQIQKITSNESKATYKHLRESKAYFAKYKNQLNKEGQAYFDNLANSFLSILFKSNFIGLNKASFALDCTSKGYLDEMLLTISQEQQKAASKLPDSEEE